MKSGEISAVDLFCGIGGLTHGLKRAGINVVAGFDNDSSCKYAYEENNDATFITKDINKVTGKDINNLFPKGSVRVLAGCAPCQTFSQHTVKIKNNKDDPRWNLLLQFLRLVRESKPDIVSMENVPQIRNHKVFHEFVDGLKEEGYEINYKVAYCPRYGIAQTRKRLLLLASKKGPIDFMKETHTPGNYPSIGGIIKHLPKIKAGETNEDDPLHRSWKLSPINMKRIKSSKPGGSWHDWNEDLMLECHKKEGGANYKAVYGRLSWDKPASTMTTQFYSYGTGRFGHPVQNRAISLREGAIIQTFPEDYKFFENDANIAFSEMGRHIGNAVPVKLGEVIGESIKSHVSVN